MPSEKRSILILGTRGIPAAHGGFETFAEHLALFLVERGWNVGVYCQKEVSKVQNRISPRRWQGIDLIDVEVSSSGAVASLEFDWFSTIDASKRDAVSLVLGYNSGIFIPLLRLKGRKVLTNMDGIEWKRPKWPMPVRIWLYFNEWCAAWSSQRLVADSPGIANHLAKRRSRSATVMIPYGGTPVDNAPVAPLAQYGLTPNNYFISIARIEPDNNILTFVEGFSRKPRGCKLVVLGKFSPDNAYHNAIKAAASPEILFPGAIYEAETVQALRFHARAYVHGHTVGGTNPSLVESLWAGNAIIAHDNEYNRWTAGKAAVYFTDATSFEQQLGHFIADNGAVARAATAARPQAMAHFQWNDILSAYERELIALS